MRGLTDEAEQMALYAVGADDGASRAAFGFEDWSLFDVQFEVGARLAAVERLARVGHAVQIDAVLGQRVNQTDTVAVLQLTDHVGDQACARPRPPQQASRKPGSFLR